MRGYKGMNKDMTCRGLQYEVGKSYHFDGDIAICKKGFHFCKNLCDVFGYYSHSESRFFEVESSGKIITEGDKSVTSDITILRELKEIEVNRGFYYGGDNGYGYRYGAYGCVNGYGDGYGDGYSGNGHGSGIGHGDGNGYNSGIGYGYDHGIGCGNGHGDGNDYDSCNGYEIHGVLIAGGKV